MGHCCAFFLIRIVAYFPLLQFYHCPTWILIAFQGFAQTSSQNENELAPPLHFFSWQKKRSKKSQGCISLFYPLRPRSRMPRWEPLFAFIWVFCVQWSVDIKKRKSSSVGVRPSLSYLLNGIICFHASVTQRITKRQIRPFPTRRPDSIDFRVRFLISKTGFSVIVSEKDDVMIKTNYRILAILIQVMRAFRYS